MGLIAWITKSACRLRPARIMAVQAPQDRRSRQDPAKSRPDHWPADLTASSEPGLRIPV